jgi:hypothetical protein
MSGSGRKNFEWKSFTFWAGVDTVVLSPFTQIRSAQGGGRGACGVQRVLGCFPEVAAGECGDVLPPVGAFFPADGTMVQVLGRAHGIPAWVHAVVLDDGTVGTVVCCARLYAVLSANSTPHHHLFVYGEGRLRGTCSSSAVVMPRVRVSV